MLISLCRYDECRGVTNISVPHMLNGLAYYDAKSVELLIVEMPRHILV